MVEIEDLPARTGRNSRRPSAVATGRERGHCRGMSELKVGDEVTWNTPQGQTHGTLVERRTKDFQLDRQTFTASEDDPMFIVESAKSGHRAAHKGSALRLRK
jgi:hypothetical protein